jgi:hypothetical protein
MFARGHSRSLVFHPDTELMEHACSENNNYIVK